MKNPQKQRDEVGMKADSALTEGYFPSLSVVLIELSEDSVSRLCPVTKDTKHIILKGKR